MNEKGGNGFTLIELMIVVAIIGILAAIAIPKVQQLKACSGGKNTYSCQEFYSTRNQDQSQETITVNGITYRRTQ